MTTTNIEYAAKTYLSLAFFAGMMFVSLLALVADLVWNNSGFTTPLFIFFCASIAGVLATAVHFIYKVDK